MEAAVPEPAVKQAPQKAMTKPAAKTAPKSAPKTGTKPAAKGTVKTPVSGTRQKTQNPPASEQGRSAVSSGTPAGIVSADKDSIMS